MTQTTNALPEALYSAAQVAAFDQRLINDFGVPGFTLMQRAAAAAYSALKRRWPYARRLCVFCGPGNNGGDGYLIGKLALEAGQQVRLISMVAASSLHGDAARARAAFEAVGGQVEAFVAAPVDADVVIDGLLGTGLSRDVAGHYAAAIARINTAHAAGTGVLAIDIASGIDATTGRRWATAVYADITVSFIGLKLGLFTGAGSGHCGVVVFDDLQAPHDLYAGSEPLARRISDGLRKRLLPPRPNAAHKGDFGHVLCIGGNQGLGGSIRMSAEAALRTGAGLVSVACHPDHAAAMSQARPELMCRGVADDHQALQCLLEGASVVALGPGLGADGWADNCYAQALASAGPLVVDADALNRLAKQPRARGNWVLTPHPGEAARLLETDTHAVGADRGECARILAQRYDAVVVLKGAGTLVATPQGVWLCTAGNPGMASGGMGDLLTGLIAALIAQGLTLADAAVLGVWLHARAADYVAGVHGERGLLATDLLLQLMHLVNP